MKFENKKFEFNNSEYNFIKKKVNSDWNFYQSQNLFKNRITLACKEEIKIVEKLVLNGNKTEKNNQITIWVNSQDINENSIEYQIILFSDVKGITTEKAKEIFQDYNFENVNQILEYLKNCGKIKGIGKKKTEFIKETLENEANKREFYKIIKLLGNRKIAKKIQDEYKESSLTKIKEMPYETLKPLIGFLKTDDIAVNKLGIKLDNEIRIKYLIEYKFNEFNKKQSNCILLQDFIEYLKTINIHCSIEQFLKNDLLVVDSEHLYLKEIFEAEYNTPKLLSNYMKYTTNMYDLNEMIAEYESNNYKLDSTQIEAVRMIIDNPISILTGGAGTGKTTVTKCTIECLESYNYKCLLLAPTGKASLRMKQVCNRTANTIHSFVCSIENNDEINYDTIYSRFGITLKDDVILIVDEFSMVDQILFYRLLRCSEEFNIVKIIIIGDPYQLQSVGTGKVLSDMLESKTIKHVQLTKTFRQKEGSKIIEESTKVRNCQIIDTDSRTNEFFVNTFSENLFDTLIKRIRNKFTSDTEFYEKFQIATSLNKSCENINNRIKKDKDKNFAINDKIINLVNDKERNIVNGDFGIIEDIKIEQIDEKTKTEIMTVYFYDSKIRCQFAKEEYSQLKLAYATTVHKLQGSEYEYIMFIINQDSPILDHKLLYTALTRGKKHVIILGDVDLINKVCLRKTDWKRITKFKERLQQQFN